MYIIQYIFLIKVVESTIPVYVLCFYYVASLNRINEIYST